MSSQGKQKIAPELSFAKVLAANEKPTRTRAIKKLAGWLANKPTRHSEAEMLKLWKGLFYCMWMCDKIPVQQELSVKLAALTHVFKDDQDALLFLRVHFATMVREWPGLDGLRLDKFYHFISQTLRATFEFAMKRHWSEEAIAAITDVLQDKALALYDDGKLAMGVALHVSDIYMRELNKVVRADTPRSVVFSLIKPLLRVLSQSGNETLLARVQESAIDAFLAAAAAEPSDDEPNNIKVDMSDAAWEMLRLASQETTPERNRRILFDIRQACLRAARDINPQAPEREDRALKVTRNGQTVDAKKLSVEELREVLGSGVFKGKVDAAQIAQGSRIELLTHVRTIRLQEIDAGEAKPMEAEAAKQGKKDKKRKTDEAPAAAPAPAKEEEKKKPAKQPEPQAQPPASEKKKPKAAVPEAEVEAPKSEKKKGKKKEEVVEMEAEPAPAPVEAPKSEKKKGKKVVEDAAPAAAPEAEVEAPKSEKKKGKKKEEVVEMEAEPAPAPVEIPKSEKKKAKKEKKAEAEEQQEQEEVPAITPSKSKKHKKDDAGSADNANGKHKQDTEEPEAPAKAGKVHEGSKKGLTAAPVAASTPDRPTSSLHGSKTGPSKHARKDEAEDGKKSKKHAHNEAETDTPVTSPKPIVRPRTAPSRSQRVQWTQNEVLRFCKHTPPSVVGKDASVSRQKANSQRKATTAFGDVSFTS